MTLFIDFNLHIHSFTHKSILFLPWYMFNFFQFFFFFNFIQGYLRPRLLSISCARNMVLRFGLVFLCHMTQQWFDLSKFLLSEEFQAGLGDFSLWMVLLLFNAGFLAEPIAHWLGWAGWPLSFTVLPVLASQTLGLGTLTPGFYTGAGVWTQVLMPAGRASEWATPSFQVSSLWFRAALACWCVDIRVDHIHFSPSWF